MKRPDLPDYAPLSHTVNHDTAHCTMIVAQNYSKPTLLAEVDQGVATPLLAASWGCYMVA
jgi:hypothetical protein